MSQILHGIVSLILILFLVLTIQLFVISFVHYLLAMHYSAHPYIEVCLSPDSAAWALASYPGFNYAGEGKRAWYLPLAETPFI